MIGFRPYTLSHRFPLMSKSRVGIVVLAAGASERMGTPKQLLPIAGTSLIRRAALTALGADCSPVVVVLGAHADLIRPELAGLDIEIAINGQWQLGMSSSIRCGVDALLSLQPDSEGILLMLADQPALTSRSLRSLLRLDLGVAIVAARYNDTLGTPALFPPHHFQELRELEGACGARNLIQRHLEAVRAVHVPEAARDLDSPEDFESFRKNELPLAPRCKLEMPAALSSKTNGL